MSATRWKSLRLLLLVVVCIAYCTPVALADDGRANSLTDSSWALQFEIGRNFTLQSFAGATISLKKHTSANAAWRLNVNARFQWEDEDRLAWSTNSQESTEFFADDLQTTDFSLSVGLARIKYLTTQTDINLFFGFGPEIGFSQDEYVMVRPYRSGIHEIRRDTDRFHAGIASTFGVEWFATSSISILAEYGARLEFIGTKFREVQVYEIPESDRESHENRVTSNQISFSNSGVRFGLSAYF